MKKQKISFSKDKKNKSSFIKRVFHPILRKHKKYFRKNLSQEKHNKLEIKLLQAGSPFHMTPVDFRLIQTIFLILIPLFFGTYGILGRFSISRLFLVISLSLVFAITLPNLYLTKKAKERSKCALKELPDMVDLLTVSLEAGLGFDLALNKLISRNNGVIASEFHQCLEEIRLGKPRREALKKITERLPLDEMNILISNILQAEKLGISMVQILRIQCQEIREKRKQRAEEQAMKAPIKMLFPLVFFIFPSLFIVLLGPAVIQFINTFNK
ncbi:MAG: type II secretion system F family protein [Anaeromicrobium sp.]|uniref:type II secretion system F family protein n=1 Tax=Anaeromicrobium sp. TaxID=1929132 RepID=UPI0025DA6890|nr:type II secretion system F family protein [Anaeromicrobium sp.]MCT4595102.1 type II secretion system F family protein [Anaeromicrobium sp.]